LDSTQPIEKIEKIENKIFFFTQAAQTAINQLMHIQLQFHKIGFHSTNGYNQVELLMIWTIQVWQFINKRPFWETKCVCSVVFK
jgi:hypothetical protein